MIVVKDLHVRAGTFSLNGICFEAPTGSYAVLMGRTGSGKTTLLEAICGLKRIEHGHVYLNGCDVTHLKPAQRGIGFVPQDGALFETMTVRDHLAFGPTVHRWKRSAVANRVDELAQLLGLTSLLDRYPTNLSGGERQRVAMGRALAVQPTVLCLDEPLIALDEQTCNEMYELLRSVQRNTGVTTLHITHSVSDANRLADQLFILDDGKLQQQNVNPISANCTARGGAG